MNVSRPPARRLVAVALALLLAGLSGCVGGADSEPPAGEEPGGQDPAPPDALAVAFSWTPLAPAQGESVRFLDESRAPANDTITSWSWTFPDGSISKERNPVHVFDAAGSHPVELRVLTEQGEIGTKQRTVTVSEGGPPNGTAPSPGSSNNTTVPPEVEWAEPDVATIRPGVRITSSDGQCTSNFVFTDGTGTRVFLGVAAHCVAKVDEGDVGDDPSQTVTNGCHERIRPYELGTAVTVQGAKDKATLAYTSWGTMQTLQESEPTTCGKNDFALVELSPGDARGTNPAMLQFGGPTQVAATEDVGSQNKVLTYGRSGLRPTDILSPREGYVVGGSGWSFDIVTVTPGLPGDSGSGVILGDGRALGVLVTTSLTPVPGMNGVTSLENALEYARDQGDLDVHLATWEQLDDGILP